LHRRLIAHSLRITRSNRIARCLAADEMMKLLLYYGGRSALPRYTLRKHVSMAGRLEVDGLDRCAGCSPLKEGSDIPLLCNGLGEKRVGQTVGASPTWEGKICFLCKDMECMAYTST